MKVEKVLTFTKEDVEIVEKFRKHILHPMCDKMKENYCEGCPFTNYCSELEEFCDIVETKKIFFPY